MIKFLDIKLKNFLSVGNIEQKVQIEGANLTLVVGENRDVTQDDGNTSANGVGKSTIIQAIHFALFGKSIEGKIKVNNLVNSSNKKNCCVVLRVEVNNETYVIERSKKPDQLNFYKESDPSFDIAQGENRDTQELIDSIIGITPKLFCHTVLMTSNINVFLEESTAKQREIIEELLGVTQLSEKAAVLKDKIKQTKVDIEKEEFMIKTLEDSNKNLQSTISSLKDKSEQFEKSKKENIESLKTRLSALNLIDVESEIEAHKKLDEWKQNENNYQMILRELTSTKQSSDKWVNDNKSKVEQLQAQIQVFEQVDIDKEIEDQKKLAEYSNLEAKVINLKNTKQLLDRRKTNLTNDINSLKLSISQIEDKIANTCPDSCPTCGGDISLDVHQKILNDYEADKKILEEKLSNANLELNNVEVELIGLVIPELGEKPKCVYNTIHDAYNHVTVLTNLKSELENMGTGSNPFFDKLNEVQKLHDEFVRYERPVTKYPTLDKIYEILSQKESLGYKLQSEEESVNPYIDQFNDLSAKIQPVDYSNLNEKGKLLEHQQFILKLLTSKDSFVRKQIIDQNINYMNGRLGMYIDKMLLPHVVRFNNDLSVDITNLGQDYDYAQLSRGEKTRLIISMSMAFRDTFEALHDSVNFVMVDELIDLGTDLAAVMQAYKLFRDFANTRNKNVLLVSHKEELLTKSMNLISVVKENNFTTINQDIE